MQKTWFQILTQPVRKGIQWYLSTPRKFVYGNIAVTVLPGVFHPGFFHSTRIILDFLILQNLQQKQLLELGCGSGIISVLAATKGALVTASDINSKAVENVALNGRKNQVNIKAVHSDLFDLLPGTWDWIVINPPYYPANPKTEAEHAWYCGAKHLYFEKLFTQLPEHLHNESFILMILSEVCDLEKIFSIGENHHFTFEKLTTRKVWVDGKNYLYRIRAKP